MILLAFLIATFIACASAGAICWVADRPSTSDYDRWGKK